MIIDLNKLPVKTMVNFNGGEKELSAHMFIDDAGNKIFFGKLLRNEGRKSSCSCWVLKTTDGMFFNLSNSFFCKMTSVPNFF